MTLSDIRYWLTRYGIFPKKSLGQHFLSDANLARALVRLALEGWDKLEGVVEIGPGLGALTEVLLAKGLSVVALEIDPKLCRVLRERFGTQPSFRLVEGDARKVELAPTDRFPLVLGNLPYNVGTRLVLDWIYYRYCPKRFLVTLQREVAERFVARPSSHAYSALSVLIQVEYRARIVKRIGPEVFYPRPEVESSAVVLDWQPKRQWTREERMSFYQLVRRAFTHRRKMLSAALGRPDSRRPEELSAEDWLALWEKLYVEGQLLARNKEAGPTPSSLG
ncbi:16S rRNA (adenine(1518)-N(6)/adenine(1519)-N(6))-dimethyltransferase RsmA [Candidatus Methylacidithermus pantelleriae]|uniref:Ribosomal RNA small subunit methyltransferase A n=1 Tax=Candidatus Methylacidithermus pantelleriae TaxID=2744239 RepID=A0A8J2FSK6_9BACT|nr:16S rRNA (adenine(1518)-N(6)/adenine(1519)-N(6))-dimethyltransferase RsmA [Candidatus Methylacidithermus pantelleriae]CAF0699081.1 Ribosomal RNA small subunit methyltransferase A [Candidatus Methylacidithermus pantelleriae]